MPSYHKAQPRFPHLQTLSRLMDTQFRIPGTQIRFGLDAIIGLVPGVGDFASFLISTYMISVATKSGASGFVVARMVTNVAIDALVGAIPLLGDLFDVVFKANQRNMQLLNQHFNEGRHRGSAGKVVIPVILVLALVFAGLVWLCYKMIVWIF
jgi:hypothetical protein